MTDNEKLSQLQMYEQSLQNIVMQKQQFQSQLAEFESALKELQSSEESYRIVGNIMVKSKKEDIKKDMQEKTAALKLRISTIEKQEENIKKKTDALQKEVMESMEK